MVYVFGNLNYNNSLPILIQIGQGVQMIEDLLLTIVCFLGQIYFHGV
jgi:hypothetical protein